MRTLISLFMLALPGAVCAATPSDNTWPMKYPEIGGVLPYVIAPRVDSVLSDGTPDPRIEKELTSGQRAILENGIEHYHQNSPIRFINLRKIPGYASEWAPSDPIFIKPRYAAELSKATFGPSKWYSGVFMDSSLDIGDQANEATIVHELMHVLGFFHEQQRPDRDSYLYLDTTDLSSDTVRDNYSHQPSGLSPLTRIAMGPFDYDSIMLYENDTISFKMTPAQILPWFADTATPNGKYVRLKLADTTPNDLKDNRGLHTQKQATVPEISTVNRYWHSAQWSIENIQNSTYFNLKDRYTLRYLYAANSGRIESRASISLSDPQAQWQLSSATNLTARITNRHFGTHLASGTTLDAKLTAEPSSTTTDWILEPMVLEDRIELSMGDLLAVNVIHGFPMSMTLASDPNSSKIHTIGMSGTTPNAGPVTVASGAFLPNGAQWQFIKVGNNNEPYFAIKNVDNGFYLRSGTGSAVTASAVANLTTTQDAHWQLESRSSSFRIKSRTSNRYIIKSGAIVSQSTAPTNANANWIMAAQTKEIFQTDFLGPYSEGKPFQMVLSSTLGATPKGAFVNNNELRVNNLDPSPIAVTTERSRWFFEPVSSHSTKYFQIRNAATGLYLHREYGPLALAAQNSVNGGGASLPGWHLAQWYFEIHEGGFYIRNRHSGEYLHNSGSYLVLGSGTTQAEGLWRLQPQDTANDGIVKQISFDLNAADEWVPLAERENAFQVVHHLAGQAPADAAVLTFENGVLSLQKLVGTTNTQKRKASTWTLFNERYTAYSIKNAFGQDHYYLGHFPAGLSAQWRDFPLLANGIDYRDETAAWVVEVYKDYFRIRNLETNQYLANSGGALVLTSSPTTQNANWKFKALNPLP